MQTLTLVSQIDFPISHVVTLTYAGGAVIIRTSYFPTAFALMNSYLLFYLQFNLTVFDILSIFCGFPFFLYPKYNCLK